MTAAIADEFGRIPMSPFLKATLARAADYATAQMHREVTLEHLLLALAEDPEASVVLKSSQIDIQRLMADVSTYLGRNDDRVEAAAQAGGAISGDLRRILEASAAAASQGRRREINGAIVLAAIVGDGKSPAAHMLRSQGLTFEQAIRALQQAASAAAPQTGGARPPSTGAPPAPRAATTDDIMASARERVITRTGPPEPSLERTQPPARPVEQAAAPANTAELSIPRAPSDNGSADGSASNANVDAIARRMGQSRVEPVLPNPVPSNPVQSNTAPPDPALAGGGLGTPTPQAAPGAARTAPPTIPPRAEPTPAMPAPAMPGARPASEPARPMPEPALQIPDRETAAAAAGWAPPRQAPSPGSNGMRAPSNGPMPPFPPPSKQGMPGGPPPLQAPFGAGAPPFGAGAPPQARPPAPPQPAPWSDGSAPQQAQRSPGYDDAMARLDARRPHGPGGAPGGAPPAAGYQPGPAQARPSGAAPAVQAGQLVENIPRKMRVGIPVIVEARIARASVKALADGLQGDGAVYRHEVTVTKAMSVRLRAPDGGFFVETASPETQWIESVLGLMSNDYASWRWSVTPQLRGKRKLQLVISARTVGTDGLTAETALPDQVIDVAVGINIGRTLAKWGTWAAAAIAGGLLSHFGETIVTFAKAMLAGNV